MSEPFEFETGQYVKKVTGDYTAEGKVVSCFHIFPESQSVPRYVVRHQPAHGSGFFCHIYSGANLRSIDRTVSHAKQDTEAGEVHEGSSPQSGVREEGRDQAVGGEGVRGRGQSVEELQKGRHTQTLTQKEIAREQGFTGDCCPICANFTMKRNGPCLVCETCGNTTGCS